MNTRQQILSGLSYRTIFSLWALLLDAKTKAYINWLLWGAVINRTKYSHINKSQAVRVIKALMWVVYFICSTKF